MKKQHIEAITKKEGKKLIAIASTEDKDRSGDKLSMKDWDLTRFKKNPVLQAGHVYDPQFTIGIAKNIMIKNNQLVFEPQFHELTQLARDIKAMYEGGILKAWSVGFIPGALGNEDKDIEGGLNELLEVSAVAVPANAECLTMAKSYGKKEAKTIEKWLKDEIAKKDIKKKKVKKIQKEASKKTIIEKKPKKKKTVKTGRTIVKLWNKQLPKSFKKVYKTEKEFAITEKQLYKKHLKVDVKDIYKNQFNIPMALIGSYLSASKNVLGETPIETRNFDWRGNEDTPVYSNIQLNSTKRDSLLTEGIALYDNLAYKVYPVWGGMKMEVISSVKNKELNQKTMDEIHAWVKENNFLRGEKFAISGEFLELKKKDWDDIYLDEDNEKAIKRTITLTNKDDFTSRGVLMYGAPGNGKTLTGKIMLNELKCSCIWITAKDFRRNDIHPSAIISMAYSLAKSLGTTVLFMEDIDNWLQGTVTDGLKTEMDGLGENKGVLTVLTSNDPENLPDALLDRPGRFHDLLEYSNPTSKVRKKMLDSLTNIETKSLDDIVEKTKGYSGAYMKELVDLALLISVEEEIAVEKSIYDALNKIEKQKKLVEQLKAKRDLKKETKAIQIKEGRVLSTKNIKLVTDCINLTKNTIVALEKILKASEQRIPEKAESNENKGRPTKVVQADDVVHALVKSIQKIAKESNETLFKAKQK